MQLLPELDKPEVRELATQAENLLAVGINYQVRAPAEYEVAGMELKRVKDAQKKLDDLRRGITRPLDAAKKAVMDFFRAPEERLARAESGIKRAMISFTDEQDRKRREEQARADEQARKERERIEAQARKAAESGKIEKAEQLELRAATVVAPVIQREPPKVAGINTREVPKFEITDETLIPREYLAPDLVKIRAVVNALKSQANIPGVRVYMVKQLAAGTG